MKNVLCILSLLLSASLFGQITGKVDYKHLGLSFTIPDGWVGQEMEAGFLMGSQTIPGFNMILPHDQNYSIAQLRAQAQAGLNEGNGTQLQLSGQVQQLNDNAIGAEFSGTMEWQPAKAYIIAMYNPHGLGITIISATTTEQYNSSYPGYARQIMNSVHFRQPESKEDIGEWKEWMKNVKLTYMESYSSTSGSTGGGYSLSKEIDLCAAGYFIYYGSSNISLGSDNSSAYSNSNTNGNGTWDIQVGPDGNPLLVLNFNDGTQSSYTLTYEDKKLYLDGTRYFRTKEGQYAPSCN